MLSVIVTRGDPSKLAGLLAALTEAAVEGLIREVILLAGEDPGLLDALCEETGARIAPDLGRAIAEARSDWLLVAPPELRLKDGWVERLGDHLRSGVAEARLLGMSGGLFSRPPEGLVIGRTKAASATSGLQALVRKLDRSAARIR